MYDISKDPDQLTNVAEDKSYAAIKRELSSILMAELEKTGDPRVTGSNEKFDEYPYGEDFDEYPYRASYKLR